MRVWGELRFRWLKRVLNVLFLASFVFWEFNLALPGMWFEFGQPRDLEQLVTAIFLHGFAAGVLFLMLNWVMVRLCGWAAFNLSLWIRRQVQVATPHSPAYLN